MPLSRSFEQYPVPSASMLAFPQIFLADSTCLVWSVLRAMIPAAATVVLPPLQWLQPFRAEVCGPTHSVLSQFKQPPPKHSPDFVDLLFTIDAPSL